ncbi:MAG: hypothetical protein M3Z27_01240 [Actinomycetota bacterium]|nr:hypothetical protein [Actinomycetota bacterium]
MSGPRPTSRASLALVLAGALAFGGDVGAAAASRPALRADRGCYLVGQRVHLTGARFAPQRQFDLTLDGVDFGQSISDGVGGFKVTTVPGGLPAGVAQHVEHADASDGIIDASTGFTLTRPPGARFLATIGSLQTLRAPFQVWGFSRSGARLPVYVHYVSPGRRVRDTVSLGNTSGQCGSLHTRTVALFPFAPGPGVWTLQIDTVSRYRPQPVGPVSRLRVRVS